VALIPFTPEWRTARDRTRRAAAYVATLQHEPDEADVAWLAAAATNGDLDHARWELRYARLALGVLTAQRDALDDQTGSDIFAALSVALESDQRSDPALRPLVERQLNDRLSGYREALSSRGGSVGSAEKLGRVLLAFASDGARSAGAPLARAVEVLAAYSTSAADSLRGVYGVADLPDDIAPSQRANPNTR
jgi:hypothetical protein